ncbi:Sua5/YciO/YrdC/YwlC family protein [Siphonobacter sp. SORGH_AS_0500]|uniref:L-threonylcarbamoyladenylate synthase n=1 Tax=Siphonobacter sp. SORGH_AS_0500 TaxID=1864824 RepID=UPI00285B1E4C|nr:Sua5/YciO/YrdC/YwlC family protein [Siphonobacter sp. SORGH_AS_0500]MDR6196000.1 L-threonylcarbamoyladenylate synthase [Siphonobacter sp. SORGH_AS_0500]
MNIKMPLQALRNGSLVLHPTDTIWGLSGDATRPETVELLRKTCQIPPQQGLIILLWDTSMLDRYVAKVPDLAFDLIEYAEDPLTVVFPQGKNVAENLLAPDRSIAIRVVKSGPCLDLVKSFGKPLVSTIAAISGQPIPKKSEDITPDIRQAAQEIIPAPAGWTSGKPSRIVRLGVGGEFEFIRK